MMAYVHLPPPPCLPSSLPPVTVISRCHCVAPGRSAYSEGKTETVSLPYALLHNSPESCETGCSIVNYPKGQTQHLFSPCSPWDELTDPQTYRPLSADRKDQLFAAPGVQRTARHQESQQKKRNEIKIKKKTHTIIKHPRNSALLLPYQVTCCTNASQLPAALHVTSASSTFSAACELKEMSKKEKREKKKIMMRSVHLLSPELSCVCLTRTTREEKHGYNPRQTSVKTRTAQKKTRSA